MHARYTLQIHAPSTVKTFEGILDRKKFLHTKLKHENFITRKFSDLLYLHKQEDVICTANLYVNQWVGVDKFYMITTL